ncbi:MAG TPA: MqnA/MqnD/SBP family protein, partial [Polyangia bacterium]
MRRLRLSTISFLNTRPITYGIERGLLGKAGKDRFDLTFDLPARCAAAVMSGEADLGLMPIASYGASTTELRIVPGIAIASRGPVRTVMLMGEVPRDEMTSVVLDGASRTSQLLVQLLLRERGLVPVFEHADHDRVVERIGGRRGGLLIGDLCFSATRRFPYAYDLGAEWSERIGLPFVYAAWIGRPDVLAPGDVALLQESLALGQANRPEIARLWAEQSGEDAALGERYLTENIHYALGARELCGAAAFLERIHMAGFVAAKPVLRMFANDVRPSQVPSKSSQGPRERALDSLLSAAAAGERLSFDDGVRLHKSASLYDLGRAADARRQGLHPHGVVTYIIDRNVNYTNACTTACQFCNFYRPLGDDRITTLTRDELAHKLQETVELGGIQVLLQGGVNPELGLDYFEDLFRWMKASFPIAIHG